jgi:hypothetical protein
MPEYREFRPHGASGYLTPMEFLRKRQKEIQRFPLGESFLNKNDAESEELEAA